MFNPDLEEIEKTHSHVIGEFRKNSQNPPGR